MDLRLSQEQEQARARALSGETDWRGVEDPLALALALEELAARPTADVHALLDAALSLPAESVALPSIALGLVRAALSEVLLQLGGVPSGRQSIQWRLADISTELDAARLLVWKAASEATPAALAMARLAAPRAAVRAAASALQIVGLAGISPPSRLPELLRAAQRCELARGTPDDQALLIAREICVID